MASIGEKYVCGGREFWCVGFNGRDKVMLRSGAVVMETPVATFEKAFKLCGSMEIGGTCVAKETYGGVVAGAEYEVMDITKEGIVLSNGLTLSLQVFTAVF